MNLHNLDDLELDEMAAAVKSFTNSRAFEFVFESQQKAYVQELMGADIGSLTASTAHASMKVLEDVKNALKLITNEQTVRHTKRKSNR